MKTGSKTTEFALALLAGAILCLLIIGAIVLRALDQITTAEMSSVITGAPPIALALVVGLYGLSRGLSKHGNATALLALLAAILAGGCTTDQLRTTRAVILVTAEVRAAASEAWSAACDSMADGADKVTCQQRQALADKMGALIVKRTGSVVKKLEELETKGGGSSTDQSPSGGPQ